MTMISKYVSYVEATKSETAIRKGIDNTPDEHQLEAMHYTAVALFDPCREHIGGPLHPSSFFRSPELNTAIGGARNSQHTKGEAIDMDCDRYGKGTNRDLFYFIREYLEFDQLIWEFGTKDNPGWVHASVKRTGNRGEVLRAYRTPDGTRYIPFDL